MHKHRLPLHVFDFSLRGLRHRNSPLVVQAARTILVVPGTPHRHVILPVISLLFTLHLLALLLALSRAHACVNLAFCAGWY